MTANAAALPSMVLLRAATTARPTPAALEPGTAPAVVPAMARHAPDRPGGRSPSTATAAPAAPVAHPTDTFEGLMMEALRDL